MEIRHGIPLFRKRLEHVALFDIDGTSYTNPSYGGFLAEAVVRAQAAEYIIPPATEQAILAALDVYRNGPKQENTDAYSKMATIVLSEWAKGLQGQSVRRVCRHAKRTLQQPENTFAPFVGQTQAYLKRTHRHYFVTAEPQFVAEAAKTIYGFDGQISTIFETRRGRFTGRITQTLGGNYKGEAIKRLRFAKPNSIAFGDSDGDIEMLKAVQYPLVIAPEQGIHDRRLANEVEQSHWTVVSPQHAFETVRQIFPSSRH